MKVIFHHKEMLLNSREIEKGNYKKGNSLIEDNLIIV